MKRLGLAALVGFAAFAGAGTLVFLLVYVLLAPEHGGKVAVSNELVAIVWIACGLGGTVAMWLEDLR